jgi:Xaa-Pro aminopeptidase
MNIHAQRRQRLILEIGDGVAIIPCKPAQIRNGDVEHEYRQDSDFHYLTGLEEPESVAIIAPHDPRGPFILFVRPRDPERAVWDGPRAGVEGAKSDHGADSAFPIEEFNGQLKSFFKDAPAVYFTPGRDAHFDSKVFDAMRTHRKGRARHGGPDRMLDLDAILHPHRLIKMPEDITALRRAAEITAAGHREAMRVATPGRWEYQVEAVLECVFRAHGSPRNGYPSIVAAGLNATILHYNTNRQPMTDGDLLLIDAGAEFDHYTADVTRTFPVNGRFTGEQRAVYDVVLAAQKASIEACVVGAEFTHIHDVSVAVLTEGMVDLGLLKGNVDDLIESEAFKAFYMHRTSHWLGMDVHDVGLYAKDGADRHLEAGMVMTVEPGLYVGETASAEDRWRGIGVRIEDDILITEDGPVILTDLVPTDPEAVEALCQEESDYTASMPHIPA